MLKTSLLLKVNEDGSFSVDGWLRNRCHAGLSHLGVILSNDVCALCKEPIEGSYCVDYVVPPSWGGKDAWPNRSILCVSCYVSPMTLTSFDFQAYEKL